MKVTFFTLPRFLFPQGKLYKKIMSENKEKNCSLKKFFYDVVGFGTTTLVAGNIEMASRSTGRRASSFLRCLGVLRIFNIHSGISQPDSRMTEAMLRRLSASSSVKKVTASPVLPALPVLPILFSIMECCMKN